MCFIALASLLSGRIAVGDSAGPKRFVEGEPSPALLPLLDEANDFVRAEILSAIDELATGQRYFTFNTFNVLVDADMQIATVEDELDVERSQSVALAEFADRLRFGR